MLGLLDGALDGDGLRIVCPHLMHAPALDWPPDQLRMSSYPLVRVASSPRRREPAPAGAAARGGAVGG